jgi:hypothetical protein
MAYLSSHLRDYTWLKQVVSLLLSLMDVVCRTVFFGFMEVRVSLLQRIERR